MPPTTSGDHREWIDRYYRGHHRLLAAYAATLVASREEAEDLVHEALAAMLAVRHPIEMPEAYVYRAIRNRARSRWRSGQRQQPSRSFETAVDGAETADLEALRGAIDTLDADDADVLVLHARSRLTFPQIAAVCEQPLGTVSARYYRAIAALRTMLVTEETHG